MKNGIYAAAIIISAAAFYSFTTLVTDSNITGKVRPASSVTNVWAINGTDSVVSNLQDGMFSLAVKPGTYKILVGAVAPYKDETIENVEVTDGKPVDLGVINLKK